MHSRLYPRRLIFPRAVPEWMTAGHRIQTWHTRTRLARFHIPFHVPLTFSFALLSSS